MLEHPRRCCSVPGATAGSQHPGCLLFERKRDGEAKVQSEDSSDLSDVPYCAVRFLCDLGEV